MVRFIFYRLLVFVPMLLSIVFFSFLIITLAPGSPFNSPRGIAPEVLQRLMSYYHLDQPFYIQFYYYIMNLLRGDLGYSFFHKGTKVIDIIQGGIFNSLLLGSLAILFSFILGVILGVFAALRKGTWIDYFNILLATLGASLPVFVVGLLLKYFFGFRLEWFPIAGWIDRQGIRALVLPLLALSFPYLAYIARLTRSSLVETLQKDYIQTARAKGLPQYKIIFKHALPEALLPVLNFLGPAFAAAISGGALVERIFLIPGLGQHFVETALRRDYTVMLGVVMIYATFLIIANLLVDVIHALIDPQIRHSVRH